MKLKKKNFIYCIYYFEAFGMFSKAHVLKVRFQTIVLLEGTGSLEECHLVRNLAVMEHVTLIQIIGS